MADTHPSATSFPLIGATLRGSNFTMTILLGPMIAGYQWIKFLRSTKISFMYTIRYLIYDTFCFKIRYAERLLFPIFSKTARHYLTSLQVTCFTCLRKNKLSSPLWPKSLHGVDLRWSFGSWCKIQALACVSHLKYLRKEVKETLDVWEDIDVRLVTV